MTNKAQRLASSLLYAFLRLFYRNLRGANPVHVLASVFLMQKVVGFNRAIPWPAHFTSRVLYPSRITTGPRSFPGWSQGCYIQARNGIHIGANLRLGPNCGLVSANHSVEDYDEWLPGEPIRIGDNVWIGMNTVVLPGVTIGSNVTVGANSVVTRDIPDNTVAAGNPCRVLKRKGPYQGVDYRRAGEG